MQYYDPNNKTPMRVATAATLLYVALLVVAMCLVRFDYSRPLEESEMGILVNFGDGELGQGEQDTQASEVDESKVAEASSVPSVDEQEVLDDPESDVEMTNSVPQESKKPSETPSQGKATTPTTTPAEKPREVNTKALFPGRTAGSDSKSQGDASQGGNSGDLSGSTSGDPEGTGKSSTGISYDLSGRSVMGKLPSPAYNSNVSGRVVIAVTVDSSGKVTTADYKPQGSTTSNKALVDAARAAARRAQFSQGESLVQVGTITYNFRLD